MDNNNDTSRYKNGADYFHDIAAHCGVEEALKSCGNYLHGLLGQELSRERNQFRRELFAAIYEAAAGRADPVKLVYPYSVRQANERGELSAFFVSRDDNDDCSCAIDNAIRNSLYKPFSYNLDIAAMVVIQRFGFQRVNAALAFCYQTHEGDERYSAANRQWTQGFGLPEKAFSDVYLHAHPVLIDGFTNHVRTLYTEVGAERFALPGQPESGEVVAGYEITRAIVFEDNTGFAIGKHPEAGTVCWKIVMDDGKRDYHLGFYSEDGQAVETNYLARVAVHIADGDIREVRPQAVKTAPAPQKPPPANLPPPPTRPHRKKKEMGAI